MLRWGGLGEAEPDLAAFVSARLNEPPAYLATIRADGGPRVHPVTPIVTDQGLFVFMEPKSPKGADLRDRRSYALHNGVPDSAGTGGEVWVSGEARSVDDGRIRGEVAEAASYNPADRYVLFELEVNEVRCLGYGDVDLPRPTRWSDR